MSSRASSPRFPTAYHDSEFLFLANIDPVLQRRVREAMPNAKLVGGDTMNYWIKDHKPALLEVLKGLDVLLINDTETRMLTGSRSIALAARQDLRNGTEDARGQAWRIWGDRVLRTEESGWRRARLRTAPSMFPRFRWKKSSTPQAQATVLPEDSLAISLRRRN